MGNARTRGVGAALGLAALAVAVLAPPSVSAAPADRPSFERSPGDGPTGTAIAVSGEDCFLPGTTTPTEAAVVRMVATDGSVPAAASALVEPDGSWSDVVTVPAGVPVGNYRLEARCVMPGDSGADPVTYAGQMFRVTGEGRGAQPAAPANPNITGPIEPFPRYDGQTTCSPTDKPGTVAFRDLVLRAYPGTSSAGISRACSVGGTSEHKEGRAFDWTLNAGSASDRAKAQDLFTWLFATDRECNAYANARRLGIMYIIWNRRYFAVYDVNDGWTSYSGSNPHTDHVHFSLTRAGAAKQTSFWRAPPPPGGWTPNGYDVQTSVPSAPAGVAPITGDFDGDTHQDLLYYQPGPAADAVLYGRGDGTFSATSITVGRQYQPLVGDFNGDCRTDVLWYGAGDAPDTMWRGRANRTFAGVSIQVNGSYDRPTVGDYNGDGIDDIVWYQPGTTQDYLWYGTIFGFQGKQVTINRPYTPLSGDYDGDGRTDIFWFGGGEGRDALWYGSRTGFTGQNINRTEDSDPPVVGDYNGDGRDDILWYGPGSAHDGLWTGNGASRTFTSRTIDVPGTFDGPVAGDFDDNFQDDLFWTGGPDRSVFWLY